jgi:hypothetical protein
MDFQNTPFQVVRHLDVVNDDLSILGALAPLVGTWQNQSGSGTGWNLIAVPRPSGAPTPVPDTHGFVLELFPYFETLTFTPVVAAANRGPVDGNDQEVQQIGAVIYEQRIYSDCTTDFCNNRGLGKLTSGGLPNLVHAETGMLMNISNFAGAGTQYARMGIIPHGNTILALGSAAAASQLNIPAIDTTPTAVEKGVFLLDYDIQYRTNPDFPKFNQRNPNEQIARNASGQTFRQITQVTLSTQNATGGILNIPFIANNINANFMNVDYWIELVAGQNGNPDFWQLQYSQTVNLVFPAANDPKRTMINWPHVGLNTLRKVN